MPFTNNLPEWNKADDAKPAKSKLDAGWGVDEKPPAAIFNWFFNKTYLALKDLITNAIHKEEKGKANGVASLDAATKIPTAQLSDASTGARGAVQLSTATNSTSTTLAATPSAVKAAYDLAASKAGTTIATTSVNGLMSAAMLSKLNGIEDNATKYTHPATHSATMIDETPTRQFVKATDKTNWDGKADNFVATASANGLMSSAMFTKLNGIATNANNYIHPATHSASMIDEVTDRRFMTDAERNKLGSIEANAQVNTITSVAGRTGVVTLTGADIPAATTGVRGTVQLSTSTTSTSANLAATPSAVKSAMDRANAGVVKAEAALVDLGAKESLLTTDKTNIVSAVNELFTGVSDGKQLVGGAITGIDPKVSIPTDATFQQLATAIGSIKTGRKSATGNTSSTNNTIVTEFAFDVDWLSESNYIQVTGLDFKPSFIFAVSYDGHYSGQTASTLFTSLAADFRNPSVRTFVHDGGDSTWATYNSHFKGDKRGISATFGSFTIPVAEAKSKYHWIAIE